MGLKVQWACTLTLTAPRGWVAPPLPRFSAVLPGPLPRFPARLLPLALPQAGQGTQTPGILLVSSPNAHDYLSG